MVDATLRMMLRVGARMLFLLVPFVAGHVFAETAPERKAAWTIESMSPDPIVLTGNTDEELAGHGFGSGQPAHARWHALYWENDALSLLPVDKVRLEKVPFDWAAPTVKQVRAIADVPGKPVMLLRLQWTTEAALGTAAGQPAGVFRMLRQANGAVAHEVLREGLNTAFSLAGKSWTLKTQVLKNSQGRLLPGSVELQLRWVDGRSAVVLGRAPGRIFKEQKVLWAGDLNNDGLPDFYIRRVLVTGHIDHIVSLSDGELRYVTSGITVDPDEPASLFTSGVGELEERESIFANSPSPYPEVVLLTTGKAENTNAVPVRYAMSGAMPMKGYRLFTEQMRNPLSNAAAPSSDALTPSAGVSQSAAMSLPVNRILKDMRFDFDGENYRMLVESVETYAGSDVGYLGRISYGEYEGYGVALQISVYHQGRRQVLLVTNPGMDSSMAFSAGDLDGSGKLSFTIDYAPHYNNHMSYTWRRSEKLGQLFQRTVVYQSQGC